VKIEDIQGSPNGRIDLCRIAQVLNNENALESGRSHEVSSNFLKGQ
jgi:hypothetical protein